MDQNQRSELLIGKAGLKTLADSTVLVVGLGGVGGACAEALARSGVGRLIVVDKDVVELSNVNRQLCALHSTVGKEKTEIFEARIHDINPECEVIPLRVFYDQSLDEKLAAYSIDFVCDCIDSLFSKMDLIRFCLRHAIPFCCSMGMARRKNPAMLEIVPLDKTSYDPMARRLRVWARKEGITSPIPVVWSREIPVPVKKGQPLPSMMMVPATAGLLMAAYCVETLLK